MKTEKQIEEEIKNLKRINRKNYSNKYIKLGDTKMKTDKDKLQELYELKEETEKRKDRRIVFAFGFYFGILFALFIKTLWSLWGLLK